MASISLPDDLASVALKMFDDLVCQGRLLYEPSLCEIVDSGSFKLEFRISRGLKKKPILSQEARDRVGAGGPFANPDPDFVVAYVGTSHVLILNMYCVYRPSYVLHTKRFASQADHLDINDFATAYAVMESLESEGPQIMIYNCGINSGSSQGHKHMQIFAKPDPFPLFPDSAPLKHEMTDNVPGVPFQHFIFSIPDGAKPEELHQCYQQLLTASINSENHVCFGLDYNVMMTKDWLCVVPRRLGRKNSIGTNSVGMLGVIWVADQQERDGWIALGLTHHLVDLGVPLNTVRV